MKDWKVTKQEPLTQSLALDLDAPVAWRRLFPALERTTYLDTGSAGVSPSGQGERVASFYESSDPAMIGHCAVEHWYERTSGVRDKVSAMLSVPAQEVEFLSSTTEALNLVGQSLDWKPGDEIVFAADDFPSITLAWQYASREGAIIRPLEIGSEADRTDTLISALTEKTRVLTAAHVHSVQGTRIDLEKIGRACLANGTLFVVDGIHAMGAVPVNLNYVDIYVSGTYKWMLSGFGLAVAVFRESARAQMHPAVRGYKNKDSERSFEFAHRNYSGLYALEYTLSVLGECIGWDVIHARTERLVALLAADLEELGRTVVAPPGSRAGVVSIYNKNAHSIRQQLVAEGIHVAAKGEYLRVSPFFYNTRKDLEHFKAAMREVE